MQALGAFGGYARAVYTERLGIMASSDEDVHVQMCALQVLGTLRAEDQVSVLERALGSGSSELAGCACVSLALLQSLTEAQLAPKLQDPGTLYPALVAMSSLGKKAPVGCLETVVSKGLTSSDCGTRCVSWEVVGNLAEAAVLEPTLANIKACLRNPSAGIRVAGAMALAGIGNMAKFEAPALEELLVDQDEDTECLARTMGGARALPPEARKPKCAAIHALGKMKASQYLPRASDSLNDTDWETRLCALKSLALFGTRAHDASGKVAELLSDDIFPVRAQAARTLGAIQAVDEVEALASAVKDKASGVRLEAVLALATMGVASASASHSVVKLVNDDDDAIRAAAVRCISLMGPVGRNYATVIGTMLNDADPHVRCEACEALGRMEGIGPAFRDEIAELEWDNAHEVSTTASKVAAILSVAMPSEPPNNVATAPNSTSRKSVYAAALAAERSKMKLKST